MRFLLSLLWFRLGCYARAEDRLPEVNFIPDGRVTLASAHWLLSLKFDIAPYGKQIGLLQRELDYFHKSVQIQLAPYLDENSENQTNLLIYSLYHVIEEELDKFSYETDMLRLLYRTIEVSFLVPSVADGVVNDGAVSWDDEIGDDVIGIDDDVEGQGDAFDEGYFDYSDGTDTPTAPSSREKRSLLGFLSPILSGLFGTPSEASWKLAQRNLRNLHQTTEALKSSLGQTLQIVNVTNTNVMLNRAAIAGLAADLHHTRNELNEILTSLQDRMENHFRLSTLIERIQALFHVTQSSLRMAMNQLTLLKSDLELAKQGNFAPTLVPEDQLKLVLRQVRAELPRDIFLPRVLTRMDWYYNLPVHLLSDNGFIYLVLDLPLRNMKNRFDLYQVIQFPGIIGQKKVYWELDSPYMAVSRDKGRYVLLSSVDAHICKGLVCKPNVAAMSYIDPRDCLLSLFKNDTKQVWEHCNMHSKPLSKGPKLFHKYENVWQVESCVGEVYNIICGSVVRPSQEVVSRVITEELQKIVLPSDCWMKGQSFSTPKMMVPTTIFKILPNVTFSLRDLAELQTNINDRRSYDLLKPDPTLMLPTIQDEGDEINQANERVKQIDDQYEVMVNKQPNWYVVAVPLMAVIFIMSAVFVICVKRFGWMSGLQALTPGITPRATDQRTTPPRPRQATPPEQVEMGKVAAVSVAQVGELTAMTTPEAVIVPPPHAPPCVPEHYEYASLAEILPRPRVESYLEPGYLPMDNK